MKIGFTGTRLGMTEGQKTVVDTLIAGWWSTGIELHHGDCKGADADCHAIARENGVWIVGHPPKNPRLRAFCECDELREPRDYLPRDRDIVDETDVLVATPDSFIEKNFGGTWYTANYARALKKPLYIVWPDGSIKPENQK